MVSVVFDSRLCERQSDGLTRKAREDLPTFSSFNSFSRLIE